MLSLSKHLKKDMKRTCLFLCLMFSFWSCSLAGPMDYEAQNVKEINGNISHEHVNKRFKRHVVANDIDRWPGRVIPFEISKRFSIKKKKKIIDVLKYIMDTTSYKGKRCIRFVKQSKERSYIKFVNGKGCKADVGYKGKKSKKTKVYLGKRCWERGMILHEVLHALGFRHEHGRHDRDRYVRINATNIIKKQKYNFRKHKPSQTTSLGLPYDYLSIMHYGKKYFAIDHKYPTVIPKKRGVYIGQRKGMSQLDIKKLQRLFGCKERKLVHKSNLYIQPPNCNFEFGLCRWKHRGILSKKNKRWYRLRAIKAARVKGPITDHTYGTFEGSYLFTKSTKRIHTNSRIQTPALSFGRYILSFWFQIKGKRLRFKIFKIDERGTYHLLFSKPKYTGVQGKWINIKRRVFSAGKTKIQFTAKFRSFISPSFVALDDVTFKRR